MLVRFMREEWQVLSVTDLVYNHTANDSQWLVSHPESTYNLQNTPHLKPAYLIDRLVYYTSYNVASGQLSTKNIPPQIDSHHHINVSTYTILPLPTLYYPLPVIHICVFLVMVTLISVI